MENRKQEGAYPYNLLFAVRGRKVLDIPSTLTKDVQAGLAYALYTLEEKEQHVLKKKYNMGEELTEEEVKTEQKALIKLQHPCRWEYICYGVVGYAKRKAEEERRKGFVEGYHMGYTDGQRITKSSKELTVENLPIGAMPISRRVYNVLERSGCKSIGDVMAADLDSIRRMRSFGEKGIGEVVIALHSFGIYNTAWDRKMHLE